MSTLANAFGAPPATTSAYVDALIAELGGNDPADVLTLTPSALRGATAGLSDDDARRPERDGMWSVLHVVRHLADSDLVSGYRLRLVVAHDRPAISGYDQDLFADRLHYLDGTLAEALEDHAAIRRTNLRWLATLSDEDRARVGVHAERGEESVDRLVRLMAGHDLVHLRQIARVRAALGV